MKPEPPSCQAPRRSINGLIPSDSASVLGPSSTAKQVIVLCRLTSVVEGNLNCSFLRTCTFKKNKPMMRAVSEHGSGLCNSSGKWLISTGDMWDVGLSPPRPGALFQQLLHVAQGTADILWEGLQEL